MIYYLGTRSLKELEGVHPDLQRVVHRAIEITKCDFAVHDGIRSMHQQREYVRRGVSKTLESKHLPQKDGYGHAVDLVPYIHGKLRWEWEPIYLIALAMQEAAIEKSVYLTWGGIWHSLNDMEDRPRIAVQNYVNERKSIGRAAFIDGPHFELS